MANPTEPHSPDSWDGQFYRRAGLASFCLCLVAGLHLFRVTNYDQTPWKGGGFGMFSTVDAENARYLRIYLITADNVEIPIRVPESLAKRARVLRALPDQELARELAERISELRYYQEDETWARQIANAPKLPNVVQASDLPQADATEPTAAPATGHLTGWREIPANDKQAGYRPQAVRVELWRQSYNSASYRLHGEQVFQVTVPAKAPAADQAQTTDRPAAGKGGNRHG